MLSRQALRSQCRSARKAMSAGARREAASAVARRLRASSLLWSAHHVGLFWPVGTELDTHELIGTVLRYRKRCYLPVIRPDKRLWFAHYQPHTHLLPNRFGIPEPIPHHGHLLRPALMDLVFVPLMGFDRNGNRLGTGGGFYDRSFAFKHHATDMKPRLIGLSFACQEVAAIPAEPWDVPLSCIVTEREIIKIGDRF